MITLSTHIIKLTMKNSSFALILMLLVAVSVMAYSQGEEGSKQTIRAQFQEMLDNSESYSEFKVIKKTGLVEFSSALQDSLDAGRMQISSLKREAAELKRQESQLTTRISDLEDQLKESEELRDSLAFVGIQMNKTTYHLLVWVVIATLAVFGVFAYGSFMRSNKSTSKTRKAMKSLEVEFDEHRKKSHEKQIKMGRELQTERNLVEELKTKLKSRPAGK